MDNKLGFKITKVEVIPKKNYIVECKNGTYNFDSAKQVKVTAVQPTSTVYGGIGNSKIWKLPPKEVVIEIDYNGSVDFTLPKSILKNLLKDMSYSDLLVLLEGISKEMRTREDATNPW